MNTGGEATVEQTRKACMAERKSGHVPDDRRKAVVFPLCKGKRSKIDCKNYKRISPLGIVGKILYMVGL